MRHTVYARLYDRLADLIPTLTAPRAGDVFIAAPRSADDITMVCAVVQVEDGMCILEIGDDRVTSNGSLLRPWLKLRVSVAESIAEVLEVKDATGYQVVYLGMGVVNQRRPQLNLLAVNWLQVMVSFEMTFRLADVPVVA